MHFKRYFFLIFCFFKLECADFGGLDMSVREINQAQAWVKNAYRTGFPPEINVLRLEVLRILKYVQTSKVFRVEKRAQPVASDFPSEIGSVPFRDTSKWIEEFAAPLTDINALFRTLQNLREMQKVLGESLRYSFSITDISQQSLLSDLDAIEKDNPLVEVFKLLCLLPEIAEYAEENILNSVPGHVYKLIAYSNSLFPNSDEELYNYSYKIREKYVDKKIDADLSQLKIGKIVPEEVKKNKLSYFQEEKRKRKAAKVAACAEICLSYSGRFRDKDILAVGDLIAELQQNGLVEEEVVVVDKTSAAAVAPLPAFQPKASTKNKKKKTNKKKRPAAAAIVEGSDDEVSVEENNCKIDASSFLDARNSSVFETAEIPLTGITEVTSVERKLESATTATTTTAATAATATTTTTTTTTTAATSSTASLSTGSTVARKEMTVAVGAKEDTETPLTLMEQIESLRPKEWLSAKDIGFIGKIFNTVTELVDSSDVAAFLKRLVTKQGGPAEYREGRGSHKLAVLVSDMGKKVLFPFAQHNGRELDRHSRNLVIDGFSELFGFSA